MPFPFNNSSNPTDVDGDILIYPSINIAKKSANKQDKNKDKLFVLTRDEVFAKKKQAAREKEKKRREGEETAREEARHFHEKVDMITKKLNSMCAKEFHMA